MGSRHVALDRCAGMRAMFEERNLKLDLFALALLALVVFLALALATYTPADGLLRTHAEPLLSRM